MTTLIRVVHSFLFSVAILIGPVMIPISKCNEDVLGFAIFIQFLWGLVPLVLFHNRGLNFESVSFIIGIESFRVALLIILFEAIKPPCGYLVPLLLTEGTFFGVWLVSTILYIQVYTQIILENRKLAVIHPTPAIHVV
jgi:hypothetical protein